MLQTAFTVIIMMSMHVQCYNVTVTVHCCNTCVYTVATHACTQVADHDASAMWLGKNLGADLTPLIDLQRKIADQVQAGADEASLLWPFVYAEINSQSALI